MWLRASSDKALGGCLVWLRGALVVQMSPNEGIRLSQDTRGRSGGSKGRSPDLLNPPVWSLGTSIMGCAMEEGTLCLRSSLAPTSLE